MCEPELPRAMTIPFRVKLSILKFTPSSERSLDVLISQSIEHASRMA